jgi:hypothetical protein
VKDYVIYFAGRQKKSQKGLYKTKLFKLPKTSRIVTAFSLLENFKVQTNFYQIMLILG